MTSDMNLGQICTGILQTTTAIQVTVFEITGQDIPVQQSLIALKAAEKKLHFLIQQMQSVI